MIEGEGWRQRRTKGRDARGDRELVVEASVLVVEASDGKEERGGSSKRVWRRERKIEESEGPG